MASSKIEWLTPDFAPFLDSVQSREVFDFCLANFSLDQNPKRTILSSFAFNDAFVRLLIRNRDRLGHLTIIWDRNMATRNPALLLYLAKNVDALYLIPNHSKLVYVESDQCSIVGVSSCNTTGNCRTEGGLITTNDQLVNYYYDKLISIIDSVPEWKSSNRLKNTPLCCLQ